MGLLTQSLTGTPCTTGKSLYSAKEAEEYYSYPNDSSAISRILMPCELLETLVQHGCRDVTSSLNIEKCDPLPTMIGGFGAVYQGFLHNGLKIAIKSIQPTFNSHSRKLIKRAAREIHAWSECTHQNVVPLVGVACFRSQLAMVSPWMENGNLMRYLSIHQPSLEGRLGLATQIAEGLAHLHQSGIVHGDLKATNVLVSEDMKAVITDFGGSTIKENSVEFINSTRGVDVSIRWAAPEILLGQDTPTCTADVYALGMTLLETFTDSEPYAGLHDATVWAKIIRQVLPERPEKHLPTGDAQVDLLWLLLNRCWATDPSSRPTATSARDKMREIDSLGPSESIMRDFIIGEGREQQSTGDPGYQSSATVLGR